ncbi:retrovirus-related pol polyprotein from transposon TNT 1-94 [Tanacetum coccineum]
MSNLNTNLQTQSSNALYNAIMEAGSKDRPPMLAPGNYVQWKSRIKRYIDTKPNSELIHHCLQNPPYTYQWAEKTVPVAEGSSETTTERYMENYKNVSQDIRDQLNAEAEAVQIILTGIDNDIYSTVDACPNACEMWKAIERLKQGESINVQDLETNLYWEFGKFTSRDGESLESYYSRFYKMMNELVRNQCHVTNHQVNVQFLLQLQPEWQRFVTLVKQSQELKTVSYHKLYDILKQHQNEVNEIRAERLARTANPLALVAQQQPVYHHQNHPTQNTQYSSTRSQQSTRNRGKAIVTSSAPTYDPEPATVTEDEEMSKEKEIDKLMALISLSFKKIYKPTNNNLRTSSNTSRANQDNSPRINRGTGYDNQRAVNVAGARENVGTPVVQKSGIQCYNCKEYGHVSRECQKPPKRLNAEQAGLGKDDTEDEVDVLEFEEAHYYVLGTTSEVTPDQVDNARDLIYSDYAGANLDRKSTTGGCQFLGRRLITWQCKKQTIVATSTIEAEYVAAASCCGQVLWIQNQMLDYGFNFMNTKIYIDNESTICIVKNPVYHSKTKHIAIRHHFIRDAYEKKLIQPISVLGCFNRDDKSISYIGYRERRQTHHGKSNLFQETPKPLCSTFLPTDVKHCLNVGYTFVNFATSEAVWKSHVCITRKSWPLFKSKKIAQVVRAWIQSKNSLVKHFEDMRLCRPSKEYLPVWFDPPRDVSMSCLTTKGMRNNGAMCARRFRESLRRVTDGAEAFLILTLFILCLDKVSTDHAKLVPLGKVCTAKETLEKNTAKGTKCKLEPLISLTDDLSLLSNMAALESCPKHNMIAYLEKTEGNVEFHEFLTSAKSKTINNVRHITAKIAGKSVSISEASIRTDLIFDDADGIDSLPNQAIFNAIQLMGYEGDLTQQPDPSPRPSPRTSPTPIVPDSIPESTGSDQAKEIKLLKAKINKLKKKAKPVIQHHRAYLKSLSLHQRFPRNNYSKKHRVHKESIKLIIWKQKMLKVKGGLEKRWMKTRSLMKIRLVMKRSLYDKEGVSTDFENTDEQVEGTEEIFEASSKIDPKDKGKKKIEEEMNLKVKIEIVLQAVRNSNN